MSSLYLLGHNLTSDNVGFTPTERRLFRQTDYVNTDGNTFFRALGVKELFVYEYLSSN